MFASLETWIERAKKLLELDPAEPDDRLPSEYVVAHYALRGYRGPAVLVAARPSGLKTLRCSAFLKQHAREVDTGRYSSEFVERDILNSEQLAEQADAVEIVPAY